MAKRRQQQQQQKTTTATTTNKKQKNSQAIPNTQVSTRTSKGTPYIPADCNMIIGVT